MDEYGNSSQNQPLPSSGFGKSNSHGWRQSGARQSDWRCRHHVHEGRTSNYTMLRQRMQRAMKARDPKTDIVKKVANRGRKCKQGCRTGSRVGAGGCDARRAWRARAAPTRPGAPSPSHSPPSPRSSFPRLLVRTEPPHHVAGTPDLLEFAAE